MANLITLSRLMLLIPLIWLAYREPTPWQLVNVPLMILIFVMDGLDGYVARKRNETSLFGSMFDIAADRVVELTMWVVAADLDLVPVWVPLVIIVRSVAVDMIRSSGAASSGTRPFDLAYTKLTRWLVGGKFMRIAYAVVKAIAFTLLMLILPLPALYPDVWIEFGQLLGGLAAVFVYVSVLLCIVRGAPVIGEFLYGLHARV
ncbi:MAG: CDP-alcohol phosphatidyltransferase family protein [Gammaproteobacteria bacterium]|nr:CDP-alcohol phosphatidyltransferase family protein [Gammaproteobacteria bacterium]